MPDPRVRHDPYGNRLPSLADAQYQDRSTHGHNPQIRRFIVQTLDEQIGDLLRRNRFGHVTITCHIQDGMLQAELEVGVVRTIHYQKDDD